MKRLLLAVLLMLAPAAARAQWHEASSTHFRVFAEGSAQSVRDFATRLERFDKGMRLLNGIPDEDLGPANRVTVYVVPSIAAVQRLARGGSTIAGFYVERAEGSVAFTPRRGAGSGPFDLDAETILLHEYAHHFLRQNVAGSFPAWFMEGFAEFNATARFNKDGSVSFGIPAKHRAGGLMNESPLPIDALLASADRKFTNAERESTIYGRGWLLTHFLTFDEARKGQLGAYLTALKRGVPSLEAARSAFGDLRALDREFRAYVRRPRFTTLVIAPQALAIGPVQVRQVSPGEAAIMSLRMQSQRGVSENEAKALVGDMRRAAAPFSNDPAVQAALAEAEYDARDLDAADAAADRALAIQPTNIDALTYKGRVAMARAEANPAAGAPAWKEVRRLLLAANRVDPNDPEPFILFYRSFGAEGIEPTRNAVTGLLRAFELAPHDGNLRRMVARRLLVEGKAAEARAALAPLAFNPHGGAGAKAMQAIIARLDEGGAAAALAAWDSADAAERAKPKAD